MRKNPGVLAYLVCLMAGWSVWAQDWPQWRGPNRDGVMRFSEPKAWPEKLTTKWKVPVGEGYASPIFAGGRILQFARQGDNEVAMSVDPDPANGSRTKAPARLLLSIARSMSGSGFMVGWSGESLGRAICQTSPWSRSPHQKACAPSRHPNQHGSY